MTFGDINCDDKTVKLHIGSGVCKSNHDASKEVVSCDKYDGIYPTKEEYEFINATTNCGGGSHC